MARASGPLLGMDGVWIGSLFRSSREQSRDAAFIALLLLCSCTAASPRFNPPAGDTVTVFIHGYRGSFLVTENAERAYLNVGDVLTAGSANLALPYPGQRTVPTYSKLTPDGPLTKLTLLPVIVSIDVYLGWMEFGRDHLPGFVPFAYDWRQDVVASGARFCDFLAALPVQNIQIVAHSMGGLVTWTCLAQDGEVARRVKKIVFAGTPFRGGPGIFDDLFLGSASGRNTSLLSRDALFTFPSSWQLLAAKGDFFVDANGAPVAMDAFDAELWVTKKWGVFAGETTPADRVQLEAVLGHHAALHGLLAAPLKGSPLLMAILGGGRPTVSGVRVTGTGFDFEHPPTADGDGSVLLTSASPPAPFTRFDTREEHVSLLNNDEVQQAIAAFLEVKR